MLPSRTLVGPRWGVRPLLALLVVSCVLPGLLGGLILLVQQYREGQRQLHAGTLQTARALVQAVDSQLLRAQAIGQVLATSPLLATSDFASFHRQARDAVTVSGFITNVLVSDESGQQVVNTAVDFGNPLTRRADPSRVRTVFNTGQPAITGVVIGGMLKRPVTGIDVPVLLNGRVAYSLGVGLTTEKFDALFMAQRLPPNWIVGIVDGTGTVAARTHAPQQLVAKPAGPALLDALASAPEGVIEATTRDGIEVVTFYTRSAATGWAVAIGIPRSMLSAELSRTLGLLAAGVVALFTAGLLLARILGERIAKSFMALTAPAQALGEGRVEAVPAVHVSEAAAVVGAMARAAQLLQQRESALHAQQQLLEQRVGERTAQLLEIAEREHAILASAASAIIATDLAAQVTSFNPAAEAMLRLREVQALGASALAFFDSAELLEHAPELPQEVRDNAQALPQPLQEAMQRPTVQRGRVRTEWTLVRGDGSRFPGLLTISVLRDGTGQAIGFLGVLTDLSERRQLEEQLRQRTREAEAASQAKSAFLATMSHELRTPLNAVIGLSQLLRLRELPEDVDRFVSHIHEAGEQLLALVSDVLDLSRIEAGEMQLELQPFEPLPLIGSALSMVRPQAQAKGIVLAADVAPDVPQRLLGDPTRLRQILLNLLSNGVKFTISGSVTLRVTASSPGGQREHLRLDVIDTGIGIAAEQQQRIFEPFTQADGSITRPYGGTGLGLTIVRRLVLMMDGNLSVQSQPGQGSTFTVKLPFHTV